MITTEQNRLTTQCQRILERLKQGPITNHELAGIALKYSSRITDLRQEGHCIKCISHDRATGVAVYELAERETPVAA